ncbi:hypothetical protein XFF6992_210049 [Xanthomonas citri pv. fuscans]|nr:hypothetical protein XFF6992_210049 [Xanthomonas citri pv. fuscans]
MRRNVARRDGLFQSIRPVVLNVAENFRRKTSRAKRNRANTPQGVRCVTHAPWIAGIAGTEFPLPTLTVAGADAPATSAASTRTGEPSTTRPHRFHQWKCAFSPFRDKRT